MISLKEARKEAVKVKNENAIPKTNSLRSWVNKGVISGVVDGSTANAKYPEHIVIEIIAASNLKIYPPITLTKIAKFREEAGLNNLENITNKEFLRKVYEYDIVSKVERLDKIIKQINKSNFNLKLNELLDEIDYLKSLYSIYTQYIRSIKEVI